MGDDIKINSTETLEETIEKLTTLGEEKDDATAEEGTLSLSRKNGDWFTSENLRRLQDALSARPRRIGLFCFGLTLLLHEEAPTYAEINNFLELISPRDIILVGDPRPNSATSSAVEDDNNPVTYGVELIHQMISSIPAQPTQTLSIAGVKFNGNPTQMQQLSKELSKLQLGSLEILESDLAGKCSLEPLLQSLADMPSLTSLKIGSRLDLSNYQAELGNVYKGLETLSINLERPIGNQDKTKHLQSTLCMIDALSNNASIKTISLDVDHTVKYWDPEDKKKILESLQSMFQQNATILNFDFVGNAEGSEFWEDNSDTIAHYLNLNNCGRQTFLASMTQEKLNHFQSTTTSSNAATDQFIESLVKAQEIPSVSSEQEETSCLYYFLSFQPDLWIG